MEESEMKKFETVLAIFLVLGLLICLTSCKSKNSSGSSEIQILDTSTTANDVSVEVLKTEKSKDNVSMEIKWNNNSSKIIEYGKVFSIYRLSEKEWIPVEKKENIIWTLESLLIYPNDSKLNVVNSSNTAKINISSYYQINEGETYRLTIDFSYNDNATVKHEAVIEFKA